MDYYSKETYGQRIASVYDQLYPGFDPAAIQVLIELADGGNALELGIGTGRIALPLMQSGVDVQGIDASPDMVSRLHAKPGGKNIRVTLGDFADVPVQGQFSLIYVVVNTIYALLSQEEQVRCFQNVTRHLASGGVFVLEAFVPDLARFTGGQNMRVTHIGESEIHFDAAMVEVDKQKIIAQHAVLTPQGIQFYPVQIRYIWTSEMDLMARLAHLHLKARWADWKKNTFSANSSMHISVYEPSPIPA